MSLEGTESHTQGPPKEAIHNLLYCLYRGFTEQKTFTVMMTTAQVVETSVTVNNNSPIQDYVHPDDQTQPTFEMTLEFKPFTTKQKKVLQQGAYLPRAQVISAFSFFVFLLEFPLREQKAAKVQFLRTA